MKSGRNEATEALRPPAKAQKTAHAGAAPNGKSAPRLCVHFDVNETIMVGDPAGGDTFDESLNKVIAKVAYVRPVEPAARKGGRWAEWEWHDGSPLDPELREPGAPPPPLLPDTFAEPAGCRKLYNVKDLKKPFAKKFTEPGSPGAIYRAQYDSLRNAMKWPEDVPVDARLCSDGFYQFLPAFFHTLSTLRQSGRAFSVVLRTFGTDLPRVREAIEAFSEGKHPMYPGELFPELRLPEERIWRGRYQSADGAFTLRPYAEDEDEGAPAHTSPESVRSGDVGGGSGEGACTPASAADGAGNVPGDVPLPPRALLSEGAMLAELQGDADALPRLSAVQVRATPASSPPRAPIPSHLVPHSHSRPFSMLRAHDVPRVARPPPRTTTIGGTAAATLRARGNLFG